MRFLISVIDEQTGSATPDEMASIDEFNDQLRIAGYWVMACGLGAPATACIIDNRSATPFVKPGGFNTSSEYVSGFWIIDVPDLQVALDLATEGSKCCHRKVEVRPFLEG